MDKNYDYKATLYKDNAPSKLLRLVGKNKRVLEVGCASGSQSRVLKEELSCVVTGIELNSEAAQKARQYCETVLVEDIEAISLEHLKDHRYDVVLFADVLEHLNKPDQALLNVMPVLEDNGYIIASIPNIVHASVIFEMIRGRFDYREYGLLDDGHVRFFTKKRIYKLFEENGFVIAQLDRVYLNPAETEFETVIAGEEDRFVLDYIKRHNDECETFQFIIKAYKSRDGVEPCQGALMEAQDKIKIAEESLRQQANEIKRLSSQLEWITNRKVYKFLEWLGRTRSLIK